MRKCQVFMNGILAGSLTEENGKGYIFEYSEEYLSNPSLPAVSLTLPKTKPVFTSPYLFPFFSNMLSEGSNRAVQAMLYHLDIDDDFGLLLATACFDTPGSVTVKEIENG